MNSMVGKVCLVAGATQGLGAAIARRLAAAGAAGVLITGRNAAKGAAVVAGLIKDHGIKAYFIRADFANTMECFAAVAECEKHFGHIDTLVIAGASTARGTILSTTPEVFDELFNTNVRGPYFLMQSAITSMIKNNIEGTICSIGSISALAGQPFINAYCASKAALSTLTANTAFSVMANRIRVNQLNVGWMASDHEREIQAAAGDEDWESKAASKLPFGRLIDPDEAARAVNFLVSADSGMMTGAIVNFDQSVWGAVSSAMPTPTAPMKLSN
jgi:NAD(P)-dependent dehydrogenase (short-subunit alcohol dehydrogenase family)